jgi:AraC-like DNA-binding protein
MYEHSPVSGGAFVHRAFADSSAEMIFHYSGRFTELTPNGATDSPLAHLQGQSTGVKRYSTHTSFGIFGVYLYPYALPVLFPVSGGEIANRICDFETLLKQHGADFTERIMLAPGFESRAALVSEFLLGRLRQCHSALLQEKYFAAMRALIHSSGIAAFNQLAASSGFTERAFERRTKQYTGFSPKLLYRVARFQQTAAAWGKTNISSLTEIALNNGYYDQAHFIHEFKLFSGFTPGQYFFNQAEGTDYRG